MTTEGIFTQNERFWEGAMRKFLANALPVHFTPWTGVGPPAAPSPEGYWSTSAAWARTAAGSRRPRPGVARRFRRKTHRLGDATGRVAVAGSAAMRGGGGPFTRLGEPGPARGLLPPGCQDGAGGLHHPRAWIPGGADAAGALRHGQLPIGGRRRLPEMPLAGAVAHR